MQEPRRFNLLGVLQKNLKAAEKKIYLHRLIYLASCALDEMSNLQETRAFNILIDSNIRLINEGYCEDIITGFGLFYTGYFINIVEGPESSLVKHLKTLVSTLNQNLEKTPQINRMKILVVCHHINKRYYTTWSGRMATPPLLLDKIEPTKSVEENSRHVQNCIMKLYRMSEFLRNKTTADAQEPLETELQRHNSEKLPPVPDTMAPENAGEALASPPIPYLGHSSNKNVMRGTVDNSNDLCQSYLPEVNLLDFLLDSPVLMDLTEYLNIYGSVPDYGEYYENVWPLPFDFVPYNDILKEDSSKKLMTMEVSLTEMMEKAKEEEEDQSQEEEIKQ